MFLGINKFSALPRAHFDLHLAAQARMSLSRAQKHILYLQTLLFYICSLFYSYHNVFAVLLLSIIQVLNSTFN